MSGHSKHKHRANTHTPTNEWCSRACVPTAWLGTNPPRCGTGLSGTSGNRATNGYAARPSQRADCIKQIVRWCWRLKHTHLSVWWSGQHPPIHSCASPAPFGAGATGKGWRRRTFRFRAVSPVPPQRHILPGPACRPPTERVVQNLRPRDAGGELHRSCDP